MLNRRKLKIDKVGHWMRNLLRVTHFMTAAFLSFVFLRFCDTVSSDYQARPRWLGLDFFFQYCGP